MQARLPLLPLLAGPWACAATPGAPATERPSARLVIAGDAASGDTAFSDTASGDTVFTETAPGETASDDTATSAFPPPNILLIIADDLGVDKVEAYVRDQPAYLAVARQLPATPTMDGLGAAGLRFTTAWSSPLCSPTRAALQTGRHSFRTGVGQPFPGGPGLALDEVTLAQQLQAGNGTTSWSTGYFGKWHLGLTGVGGESDWDLDESAGTERTVKDLPNPVVFGWSTFDGALLGVLHSYTDWTRVVNDAAGTTRITEETTYATAATVQSATAWITAQTGPWFATVAFNAPHAASGNSGHYADVDADPACAPVPAYAAGEDQAAFYRALVECMDDRMAGLLRAIPPEQMANTLIVFMGDNGTPGAVMEGLYADRGGRSSNGKATVYETGVHVPLTVTDGANWLEWQACPDLRRRNGTCTFTSNRVTSPGRVVEAPVQLVDVYATVAELTGVDASTAIDSTSFAECLRVDDPGCSGDSREHPRRLYTEGFACDDITVACTPDHLTSARAAFRRGPYKLVATFNPADHCLAEELYAVRRDPFEHNDLAATEPEIAERLHAEMLGLGAPWMAGLARCAG